MMRVRMPLVLAAALWTAAGLNAAGLRKIDRSIAKEPAYKNKPKYCLLVFGEQARTRVWLVQDGDVLYVDRNANGDLTEKGERVAPKESHPNILTFEAGDIHDGALKHTGLTVMHYRISADDVGNAKEMARILWQSGGPWAWAMNVAAERPASDKRSLPKRINYNVNLALAFAPDGKTLAVGVGPGNIYVREPAEIVLWDLASCEKRATLRGHVGNIWSLAFNKDGTLLASGGVDNTIKLWNIAPRSASKR